MSAPRKQGYLSAGLLDAGFASLASFCVGIAAVRLFDSFALGVYALVFSGFNLVAAVPQQLLFAPFEVASLRYARERRLAVFRASMRMGGLLALLASSLLTLWLLVVPRGVPAELLVALTTTGVACAFLSPVQDHLRRMQHLADRSAAAAAISAVQLAAAVTALVTLWWLAVPPGWIPLGSLALANLVSSGFGLLLSMRWLRKDEVAEVLELAGMLHLGKWLLVAGLSAPAGAFAVGVLIVHLAGAAALGYAESARIVGQPMVVLAMGLSATLGPRAMEAARERDRGRARGISRQFCLITGGLAGFYLLLFGFPWAWNPMLALVPKAFEIAWLVPAVVLATTLNGSLFPLRSELLGARREKAAAVADSVGALARIGAGATASVTGSFAMPLGYLVLGAIRWRFYLRELRGYYGGPAADDGPVAGPRAEAGPTDPPLSVASRGVTE